MPAKYGFKNKHNVGDIITNLHGYNYKIMNFKIQTKLNKKPRQHMLFYLVECQHCKKQLWIKSSLLNNYKCKCNNNHIHITAIKGFNDIPTTAPWMVKYFPGGIEQASKYTKGSHKKIDLKCPYCGRINKGYEINSLRYLKRLPCICVDSVSYPEKFMSSFLEQLKIPFERQAGHKILNFSLEKKYRYDFFLKEPICIIETHGSQHYRNAGKWGTYEEIQENDVCKENIAKKNGILNYVVLDCRESSLDWIKNSIMNSILPTLLNFKEEDIDWVKCDKFAQSNIIKNICEYYMEVSSNLTDIENHFKIGRKAITKYLKKGAMLNWCIYEPLGKNMVPVALIKDGKKVYFENQYRLSKESENLIGVHISPTTLLRLKDTERTINGYAIKTLTNNKDKLIAIYGDKAVKWFEEHEIK